MAISAKRTITIDEAIELLRRFDTVLPHRRPLLQPGEVAETLQTSIRHVYHLIEDGSIDLAVDVGGKDADHLRRARIDRYALLRFMLAGRMI